MNAKKFDLELQKAIQLKTVTPKWILNLYKNDKVSFFHHVPVSKLLQENYQTIIEECSNTDLIPMVNVMYRHEEMQKTIKEHYLLLIQKCKTLKEFTELLMMEYFDNKRYFNDNLTTILGNIPNEYIFALLTGIGMEKTQIKTQKKFFKEENQDIINKFLIENKKEYIEFLFFPSNEKKTKQEEILIDLSIDLIEEILAHENLEYKDIKWVGKGTYSKVIQIGSKIIKIGKRRRSYEIPYDKAILSPIIRIDLSKISNVNTTIEVMENVSTSFSLSKEELYQFYVSLREKGIVFADIKPQNLGILLKDNKIYWNKNLSLDNENRGIYHTIQEEPLKKGSIVILDTDYLYTEEDYQKLASRGKFCWGSKQAIEFEEEYQKQKPRKGRK